MYIYIYMYLIVRIDVECTHSYVYSMHSSRFVILSPPCQFNR
jgi:hypothetical protein